MFSKKDDTISDLNNVISNQNNEIDDLKKKNAILKGVQLALSDPYYVRDMDYNIIYWSDTIAKLTGYSAEDAKKMKCYEMFKAVVCPPKMDCPTQKCIFTKDFLRDVAVDVFHKNGSTIHTLVSNSGIYDELGNAIGAVEIVKDNTIIKRSMDKISDIIKHIENDSAVLSNDMEQANKISTDISEMSKESLNNLSQCVKNGRNVSVRATQSSSYGEKVKNNMDTINESMKFSHSKIAILKNKSEIIIEFVKMIQSIAMQTNLLALNASVEAAHAGEAGRGFAVVADGIRELSKNTQESSQKIEITIQEIINLINETTISFDDTEKHLNSGTDSIIDLLSFTSEINQNINNLLNNVENIEHATVRASKDEQKQLDMISNISQISRDLQEIVKNLTSEFKKVFNVIQRKDMG